ncbi:glycosyltransferase 87 family protein [Anaeromyxobacter diazotrophicus]|uniref:DUF2029 domain-containing protein n=1 Tax=Anaeromyxobacter diazotrophicus TaxID=2590199 RepID=A0A7I9VIY0_9BACT|nr:glycosyltransferase 87 family protein [Anaeromyxobacter diazotrophicus]GEJ56364.1 hypothetical protein AMYX_11050 [Anaeromyxobacter diazotrophicus]
MLSVPRREALGALAWPAALAVLAAWGLALAAHGRGADLAIYVRAAARFLRGEALYQASDGAWVFKYAPPSAVLFAPLTLLPARAAAAAWNLLLVASLAALAPLLRALLAPAPGEARAALSGPALALALVAVGQSLFLELFYGQVDLPMLLLLLLSAAWAGRGAHLGAGAAWALAVALKPPAVLFGLYLLLVRRPRAVAAGAAFGLALWLPVLARYGGPGTAALAASWSETVTRTTLPWVLGANSQGLPTLLLLAFGRPPEAPHLALAQAGALALTAAALWTARRSRPRLLAATCFAVAFTSALAWRANFALALPMVALALTDRSRRRRVTFALVAVAAAVELAVVDGVVGRARLDPVLLARPFALAFGALLAWTLASARLAPASGGGRAPALQRTGAVGDGRQA